VTTATRFQPWACPDSRIVLRYDAPREQWLRERLSGIGGSEIGVLLGLTPPEWSTRHGLWLVKTGLETDDRESALMERGSDIEPIILRKFTEKTGLATRRVGLQRSRRNPRMLISSDALAEDGATVEAKLVSRWGRDKWVDDAGERQVPPMYAWQVRHGLAVTGKRKGYVAALDADSWQLEIYEIEAADGDFDLISGTVDEFWRHVTDGTPPPIDYASASPEEMLSRFREIVHPDEIAEAEIPRQAIADRDRLAEIRALGSAYRRCEKEEREIKTRITMQIGDREYLGVPDGNGGKKPIFHWKQVNQTQFREKDLKADHPALAEEYTDRGKTRRLEIVKDGAP